MDRARPSLELTGASVRFGPITALDTVDFRMFPGEVHSLMGENGAGKSTLIKAITGAVEMSEGTLTVDGRPVILHSPHQAREYGIAAVYQEIDLLPNLSVAENIALGREPRRWGRIDSQTMRAQAREILGELGVSIDPASLLGGHSLAIQQMVAIARAVSWDVKILVLDEPTSSLDLDEVAELFRVIRELRSRGVAILFVSHFLEQVYEICDRITVLRDGALVGEYLPTELLRIDLVQKMLGREIADVRTRKRPESAVATTDALVVTENLSTGRSIADADVSCDEGAVLGLAGLLGSGRTSLARAIAGVDRITHGRLVIDGRERHFGSPSAAVALGVVYSSENRRSEGIVEHLSVADNIALAVQAQRGPWRRITPQRKRELADSWVEALGISADSIDQPAGTLSGGNQQKVMLARLLALSPRVLVLDEPTRGIDVGAKVEVQNLVADLADNGLTVIFVSAELEEVLRVSDKVAVLRQGTVADVVAAESINLDALLALVADPEMSTA